MTYRQGPHRLTCVAAGGGAMECAEALAALGALTVLGSAHPLGDACCLPPNSASDRCF